MLEYLFLELIGFQMQNNSLLTFKRQSPEELKKWKFFPGVVWGGDPCLAWHPEPLVVLGNTKVLGDRLQGPSWSNHCQQCYRTPSSIRATKLVINVISSNILEFGAMSF